MKSVVRITAGGAFSVVVTMAMACGKEDEKGSKNGNGGSVATANQGQNQQGGAAQSNGHQGGAAQSNAGQCSPQFVQDFASIFQAMAQGNGKARCEQVT